MAIQERVSTLERLVGQVAEQQLKTERSLERLSEEMVAFKDEVRRDTSIFKEEIRQDTRAFKDEVRAMNSEANERAERAREELNRKCGELANRLGTLVEDIVAPNIPAVALRYFGVRDPGTFAVRFRRDRRGEPGTQREFDVIAYTDTIFLLAEAKSWPRPEYAHQFVALLPQVPEYFPEAVGKELIPIFASLRIPEDVTQYLTRHGVYCMAMAGDTMVLTNYEEVRAHRPPRTDIPPATT